MLDSKQEDQKEAELASGLVAYWPFDEESGQYAQDMIRAERDPVHYVFHEAKFTAPHDPVRKKGVRGNALLFDGYSTWVERSAEESPSISEALTITAWVAPRSYEWGDEERLSAIVNQHDREAREGYILGVYRHGDWSFQLGLGGRWVELWVEDRPLVKNQWSYMAATYDRLSGEMILYLNGEQVAKRIVEGQHAITPSSAKLMIGRNNQGTVLAGAFTLNMFSGLMDEVRIYNRALQPDEILGYYEEYVSSHGDQIPVIPYEDIKLDRSLLANDRHRPQYHLSPPQHWMNEPHAPIYFNGRYHLFYQHNPHGPYWHQIHWGHWVSEDLVHWRDLPIALAPEKHAVDPDGVWSGSAAYDENGVPALFFTAGDDSATPNQRVGLARSTYLEDGDLDLVNWVKHPEPLIVQEPGVGLFGDFRDPFVWKEGNRWYLIIGSGTDGQGGTALAYMSDDMMNWEYKGPLYVSNYEAYPFLGPVWELPVLLPLGESPEGTQKHLFLISPVGAGADVEVFYWIGTFDREEMKFYPDSEEPQLIDVGDFHFTGPSGMVDPRTGRKIIFTIAQGERTPHLDYQSGWAHNAGLPISVYLREDGRLGIEPIEELQALRGDKLVDFQDKSMEEANQLLEGIAGDMLEIRLELEPVEAESVGIKVRRTPDGAEETLLYYSYKEEMLKVNRMKTTLDPFERSKGIQGGGLKLDGDHVKLHIYLDRSMIEVYANGLKSLTTRAYPSREDALGLQIWGDGSLRVKSMEVWEMKPAF